MKTRGMMSALMLACVSGTAMAQVAPIPEIVVDARLDSGVVMNEDQEPAVIYTGVIQRATAPWIRLRFDEVQLAGDPAIGNGSYLRITSAADGGWQRLDANSIEQWGNTSAYFNGDLLTIELIAYPGTGPNRITMSSIWIGEGEFSPATICGPTDDRVLSNDPRSGRLMSIGCSAWLYNNGAGCFGTAGHCISASTSTAVMQFNVPLSNPNGSVNHPHPDHQYPVQQASIQSTGSGGTGNDAAMFGCFPNSNTGLTPLQAQGAMYTLRVPAPSPAGQIRITGYGTTSGTQGTPREWSQVQKTHVGNFTALTGNRLQYTADTTGGNSGSPVILESTGEVIGVHTHGGCTSSGGANSGTATQHTAWTNYRDNPRGVCIPPQCYPDCDQTTGQGVLDIFDFLCFQNRFANGDPYACDCDLTTGNNVCDIFDFLCFQNTFAGGC